MTDAFSERANEILLTASELELSARNKFVRESCSGDTALLREVEALLDASEGSDQFFADFSDRLGIAALIEGTEDEPSLPNGEVGLEVGPYRLTRPIGAGGMGAVWQAERSDGRFEGVVAVKLLTTNASASLAKRFDMEGQFLARLTHPNIARLLDAGVLDNGQAYLVLEYVDGVAIDQYCDSQGLTVQRRLDVFLAVLDAVTHAHSNLIVHRDIKPTNVLVSGDGQVKLLDFGVAKLLQTENTAHKSGLTKEFGTALTPEFAAPEQLLGESVTTATDVYSLGLLLYVLLTGVHPRPTNDIDSLAALHAALEKEPANLSNVVANKETSTSNELSINAKVRKSTPATLQRLFRGDLDNILRKALATDPLRRYRTVNGFATDLRRYLRHEPVTAQPDTVGYRFRKFARRHRGGVVATLLTVLALLTAVVVTTMQTIEADRQRAFALRQQQLSQTTNSFMNLLLAEVGANGGTFTVPELLDRGVVMLEKRAERDPSFSAATFYDIGQHYANVGSHDRAIELLERAESIARENNDTDILARVLCLQAMRVVRSNPDVARAKSGEGSSLLFELPEVTLQTEMTCTRARSNVLELDGEADAAAELLEKNLVRFDQSALQLPDKKAAYLSHMGALYFKSGRLAEVLKTNEASLEILRNDGREGSSGYLMVMSNQAAILQSLGEIRQSNELREQLIVALTGTASEAKSLPYFLWRAYAVGLRHLGRQKEALEILIQHRETALMAGSDEDVARFDVITGAAYADLGNALEANKSLDAAENFFLRSSGSSYRFIQGIKLGRVKVQLLTGNIAGAQALIEELLVQSNYAQNKTSSNLIIILLAAAEVALAAKDPLAAERYATDCHDIAARIARDPAASAHVGQALLLRAKANRSLLKRDIAIADLESAIPALTVGLDDDHPDTLEAKSLLAEMQD